MPASELTDGATGDWIERLGRAGYGTKGVVYGLVGVLAGRAAIGAGGSTEDAHGAIAEIGSQPFGTVLLVMIAIGLFGYALWRLVSAAVDPHVAGDDARGWLKRAGYAVSGFVYLSLAFWAASAVLGGGSDSGGGQQEWTARLLFQPAGPWLVGLVGVIVIGVAGHHFYQMATASFMKHYDRKMPADQRKWAKRLGQFGLAARGVTFLLIGAFLIVAGVKSDPSEARGLGGALQTLASQPYGPWALGIVALGLVSYGIYCISRGWYSRFELRG